MIINLNLIKELIEEGNYWYFGNHSKSFIQMCYLVDLVSKMPEGTSQQELDRIRDEFNSKNNINLKASMFKSMIMSRIYGLLDKSNNSYTKSKPTNMFNLIKDRTNGNFSNVNLYADLIEQQIEKIFCITPLVSTEGKDSMQLYPLFLLYKVILEIGAKYNKFRISKVEFEFLVSTASKYSQWQDIVETIIYHRENFNNLENSLSTIMGSGYLNSLDQRYHQIIEQLPQFNVSYVRNVSNSYIELNESYVNYVRNKVNTFEVINTIPANNYGSLPNGVVHTKDYLDFLGKNIPLLPSL